MVDGAVMVSVTRDVMDRKGMGGIGLASHSYGALVMPYTSLAEDGRQLMPDDPKLGQVVLLQMAEDIRGIGTRLGAVEQALAEINTYAKIVRWTAGVSGVLLGMLFGPGAADWVSRHLWGRQGH